MQVTVESTGTLERRMRVELPAERIEKEIETRLKSVGRTAKIKGFRPGKEPFTALATAVVPLLEPEMSKTDRRIEVRKMSRAWRAGDLTLAETLRETRDSPTSRPSRSCRSLR